jgi:aromatic-L-amino-acid decarboxylase
MDRLNNSGELFLTHTRLNGKMTLRMSIMRENTQREHLARAWDLMRSVAEDVYGS